MIDKTANNASFEGGDGVEVFPIPFPFLDSGHIRARLRRADGGSAALAAGKDYSIVLDGDGHGELHLLEGPLAAGSVLTISRLVPLTQEILFHNQGPNSPRAIEAAADKLTMISQQLQEGLEGCLVAPDGASAHDVSEAVLEAAGMVPEIRDTLATVAARLDAKAERSHNHDMAAVIGLQASLDEKADAAATRQALNGKADAAATAQALGGKADAAAMAEALAGKAALGHRHDQKEIDGLDEALAGKVDTDDPRLGGAVAAAHAASHGVDGEDPLSPESIGSLSAPPADGKPYLAANGGWIEYVAPSGGGDGEGTSDHSQLVNRDAADQHPQSAIRDLVKDLAAIDTALANKAGKSDLPSIATSETDGLLSAADKRRLDDLPESFAVLPSGGTAGDLLAHGGDAEYGWLSPAGLADALPLMSANGRGVARLAAGGGLVIGSDGALGLASDNLLSKSDMDNAIAAMDSRIAGLESRIKDLGSLEETVAAFGGMASAEDAPADGNGYLRRNRTWVAHEEGAGGGGDALVGEIRLLPHRAGELPSGWYFCNGDRFALTSVAGKALQALSAAFKSDWNIAVSGDTISLPNLFLNGDGYFLRPVDNSSRLPGSNQEDAIRNITGSFQVADNSGAVWISSSSGISTLTGAFTHADAGDSTYSFNMVSHGRQSCGPLLFDASRAVPTAGENRPRNIGMTPAIYLGA